jgi:hypothetical protein
MAGPEVSEAHTTSDVTRWSTRNPVQRIRGSTSAAVDASHLPTTFVATLVAAGVTMPDGSSAHAKARWGGTERALLKVDGGRSVGLSSCRAARAGLVADAALAIAG